MRLLQARRRKRIDEPEFNKETSRVLRDAREGKGLVRCDDLDELFDGRGSRRGPESEAVYQTRQFASVSG